MTSARPQTDDRPRSKAIAALALLALGSATAILATLESFPSHLVAAVLLLASALLGLDGVIHRGARRVIELAAAALASAASVIVLLGSIDLVADVATIVLWGCGIWLARGAFSVGPKLSPASPPSAAVMFWNPKSGDGKALAAGLAEAARARGIKPIELRRDDDLRQLVLAEIAAGADALAAAGGDGTQAIVAAIAAEHELPFACIPAGTRNHFALDLGVDRDDLVGSLDAFVNGGEKLVDLGEVNGQVFVNNVSLGLYAEAVQREDYRGAKLRTLLDMAPEVAGPDGSGLQLEWVGGDQSGDAEDAVAILISNNRYRVGRLLSSGTRPSIDDGLLGVTVFETATPGPGDGVLRRPWREWTTPEIELAASEPVAAGIDGEATTLIPPLRFRIRHRALRVRIAGHHPGVSPSAALPDKLAELPAALWRAARAPR
jgi:diacylglycerol kinase family enzyme